MPSATSRKPVFLHAFAGDPRLAMRCKGVVPPPPTIEECVLYAGHTGVSFTRRGPIYGFLPSPPSGLSPVEVVARLKNGEAFPGRVGDDRPLFQQAAAESLRVVTVEYHYETTDAKAIEQRVATELTGTSLTYGYPGHAGDCNCATWLGRMGLHLPEPSGQMSLFVPDLEREKAAEPVVI